MIEDSNKLGKLSLAIVENFVESKLGKNFVAQLHAPTDEQSVIVKAMQSTADRLWKEWDDKRLWNAVFNNVPKNKMILNNLKEGVKIFYKHPSDMGFSAVLTQILMEYKIFDEKYIHKAVEEYITMLTEELMLEDKNFRESVRDLSDLRVIEILKRVEIVQGTRNNHNLQSFRPGNAPPHPSLMIGREYDIMALKERLRNSLENKLSHGFTTVIKGWPGVGKTTIVTALAYDGDIAMMYPDGVLWTSLGHEPIVISKMAEWGRALGTDEIIKAKTVDEAKNILASMLHKKRMLLIVDDVLNAEDAGPFMVGGSGCAILIATRLDMVADALAPTAGDIYRLKVLKDEDALDLLRNLAPYIVNQHSKECLALVQDLEGLPLAIQVAGRFLNTESNYGFGVRELIDELRQGSRLLEAKAPADRADLVTGITPTIATLLYTSIEHLDEATKNCYAYLGVFAPKPATFEINAIKYVCQVEDPKPLIRILVDRGLLEYLREIDRYQMHPLMVMLAKTLLVED